MSQYNMYGSFFSVYNVCVCSNICMHLYDDASSFSVCLQRTLVALCRDLTGVARSFTSKTSYMMLFDWVYPTDCAICRDFIQRPVTPV